MTETALAIEQPLDRGGAASAQATENERLPQASRIKAKPSQMPVSTQTRGFHNASQATDIATLIYPLSCLGNSH